MIATAALATTAGFLVLLLSPIPMVRGFGLLLVLGIVVAFAVALTAGLAALSLTPRDRRPLAARRLAARGPLAEPAEPLRDTIGEASAAVAGRIRLRCGRAGARGLDRAPRAGCSRSALVLAIVGWARRHRGPVISDIRELVPSDLPELRDVDELQNATGVSGEMTSRSAPTTSPIRR